jgi:transposase
MASEATDMRCGFDRLAERVRSVIGESPQSGHLFVFRSRRGDRLKILVWDRDGFVLWYKRLEIGVFKMPRVEQGRRTPDTKVHHLDQSSGHNKIETYNIEVVDWEEHVDDLMQVIQQKCACAYPSYFGLLILGRSGKVIDPNTITEAIRSMRVPFAEIWIVGRALEDRNRVQMVRLFPDRVDVPYDLGRALKRTENQKEFMRPEGRGTGTEVHPRGDIYLPIP